MREELIKKAQEQILFARAHVESTFMDPTASTELLADHARIHGQLTNALITLNDAMTPASQSLPPMKQQPATRTGIKPESEARAKRRDLSKARAAVAKPKLPPTSKADKLGVACPDCPAYSGEFCIALSTDQKPTGNMLSGFHAGRVRRAAELKAKGKLRPWVPPAVEESDPMEARRRMDRLIDELEAGSKVMEELDAAFPGSEMIVIDGVGVDVDRVRDLVNKS